MKTAIPTLLCDFYKTSHRLMYPEGAEVLYSTLTPRSNKYAPHIDRVVVFGIQAFIQKYLIDYFKDNFFKKDEDEVVEQYLEFLNMTGTRLKSDNGEHIRALHQLGYLPLRIKAIPEGETVAIRVPVMTIENTHKDFAWLTNYFETLVNCSIWQPMVSASIARVYRKTLESWAEKTCDDHSHVDFQAHDFSMRGMSSLETAETSGAAHLVFFKGTDTIPAISYVQNYYPTKSFIGGSIPASEHSVMSAHGLDELPTFRYLMEKFPDTMLSIVSDTTDFWHNVSVNLPILKDEIMARPEGAKVVIRPDSGDPVDIVVGTTRLHTMDKVKAMTGNADCYVMTDNGVKRYKRQGVSENWLDDDRTPEQKGLIECLWETFGGTINSKGYKVLHPCIGAIYGDSITYERMCHILEGLAAKGFATSNIVFGVGSFTYQYNTRDTLGFATKATSIIINGAEKPIFKDPKTDDGTKKSQRGRVKVINNGSQVVDGMTATGDYSDDELELIFENGELKQIHNFEQVRQRALRS